MSRTRLASLSCTFGVLQLPCSAFLLSSPPTASQVPSGALPLPGRHLQQQVERHQQQQWKARDFGCAQATTAARGWGPGEVRAQVDEQSEVELPLLQQEEGFQWRRQWYPAAVMRDLEARDPRQPFPFKLLGESLVVWKDPADGGWKAFADRCPHRWAPLSEGRVNQETGRLHCIYHGWEFEGDGRCGSIPQADPESREVAQNSKRACATVIPTKIAEGKLWLWPDSSPDGIEESKIVEPVMMTCVDLESGDFGGQWYSRDLAYGADTLIENLVDPAHIPFAHHGVLTNRAMGGPTGTEIDEEASGEDEFVTEGTGFSGRKNMRVAFKAPGLVYYENDYTETVDEMTKRMFSPPVRAAFWLMKKLNVDKRLSMKAEDRKDKSDQLLIYFVGYAVPTSPGRCRIFTRTARNFLLQHPVIPRRFRNSIAKEHLSQHLVLDGDSHALHVQERFLANAGEQGVARPEKTFYMPTSSDGAIRRFRQWYNSRGGGGPTWPQGVDGSDLGLVLPHEQTLDRMAHTKECSACSKAFKVSGAVKRIAVGTTLVLLGASAVVPRGVLPLGLAGGAFGSAGLAVAMSRRQQKFVFVDYIHAQRE